MRRLMLVFVLAAALFVPSGALAGGVVVKVDRASHQVAVADVQHRVALVHTAAAARLRVGERVAFRSRRLTNGTLAAPAMKVVGRVGRVEFVGLVLARLRTRYVVSAGGAVLSVRRGAARGLSSASDTGPGVGATVQVSAAVDGHGELESGQVSVVAPATPGGEIDGLLTLGSGTITVTAERMSLVLRVPAGLDLSSFRSGQEVLARFTQQPDGGLALTTLSGNEDVQQANGQEAGDDGAVGGTSGGNGGVVSLGNLPTSPTGSPSSGDDSGGDDGGDG